MPDDIDDSAAVLGGKAMYDYTGTEGQTDDLTFGKGDVINIIMQGQDGWWYGEKDGRFGKFPGSYVKVMALSDGDVLSCFVWHISLMQT